MLPANILNMCLGLITSVIIARFYGADVMGIMAILNSFLSMIVIFTLLGTETSVLRLIPEHSIKYSATSAFKLYRKVQWMVIYVSVIIGTLSFLGANFIAVRIFSKPYLTYYFALAAVFVVFKSMTLLNTQATRGLKLIRIYAFMHVLPAISNLLLLILLTTFLYIKNNPIYTMLASLALTGIIGWVIIEHAFKKRMQPRDPVHLMPTRTIFSISMPMFMTSTVKVAIAQIGIVMLGMFRSEAEVGYYSIAVKLAMLTMFATQVIGTMTAPKFSELFYAGKLNDVFYVAKKAAKLAFWATTPLLIGLVIIGKPFLFYVYGGEFIAAYPALLLLVVGQLINSITGENGTLLNMTGKQNVYLKFTVVALLINIIVNMLLTPKIGIIGSASAAMLSTCFLNIAAIVYMKVEYGHTTGYMPFSFPSLRWGNYNK